MRKMSWCSGVIECGILRKNDQKDKLDELLVFGYACKLFRDDEKALEIDQGKQLIPWMGDESLKIDRYDARGTLSDLKPFEASKEGFDAMRWLGLSESERKIEQLCDKERYYSLHINEEEEQLYKEEELKRAQSNQIQYSYDENQKTEESNPPEEDDELFTPSPELDIPVNMILPKTVKENARIEKTAEFISKQGPQMEILLKTKQAGNPQFAFLTQSDPLYQYYRHLLMAIKNGIYTIKTEIKKAEEQLTEESHYLHPSLASEPINISQPVPPLPQISYKPSADCAYSQLVNRIQGQCSNIDQSSNTNMDNQTAYAQLYQQYGYQQYYYEPSQLNHYQTTNLDQFNSYPQVYPTVLPPECEDKHQNETTAINEPLPCNAVPESKVITAKPLLTLAEYSDSESDGDNQSENDSEAQAVVIPPIKIQVIIDKLACYVAKNGKDFENIVRGKSDSRFLFLESDNIYNPYYNYKIKEFSEKNTNEEKLDANNAEDLIMNKAEYEESDQKNDLKNLKVKEKKIISPVSFSIKKPKDTDTVARDKSALLMEDSTDDETAQFEKNQASEDKNDRPSYSNKEETNNKENIIEIDDSILELIDLTDELEEKRDKRAEDRVKDKIAAAAREKLAEKNRALQLERKKRAAAFLSQLKPSGNSFHSPKDEDKEQKQQCTEVREVSIEKSNVIEESRIISRKENRKSSSISDKERSRSGSRHKLSHRHRKSYKRSHSHSRKHTRERRSRDRKKSKRRHQSRSRNRSRSRSTSRYHKSSRSNGTKKTKRKRNRSSESSSNSSSSDKRS